MKLSIACLPLFWRFFFGKGKNSIEKDNENFWRHPFAKNSMRYLIYRILIILWKTSHLFSLFVGFLVLILAEVHRAELVGFVYNYIFSLFISLQKPWSGLGAHFGTFLNCSKYFLCGHQAWMKFHSCGGRGGPCRVSVKRPWKNTHRWSDALCLILVKAVILHSPSIDRSTDR